MKKTQKEIEPNSVFIREPFSCWDSKFKKGFVWAEVNCILYDFENCWNRQPAVNELLNLHNIRVDEEFLHDPTCILWHFMPVYRPKMAYKTPNVRYFWRSIPRFCPMGKISALPDKLNVGAKRAILGKYWQKELSKTLVRIRRRMIPAPLTLVSNRIR